MTTPGMIRLLVVVLAVGCGTKEPAAPNDGKKGPPSDGSKQKPDVSLSAGQFAKEYADNLDGAVAKYNGKTIEIEGVLDDMPKKNAIGDSYVTLEGHTAKPETAAVMCRFRDGLADKVAKLSKGQKIKVIGKGADQRSPAVYECDFVEVSPAPK